MLSLCVMNSPDEFATSVELPPHIEHMSEVYPALLSRVAEAFYTRVPLSQRIQDDITYNDAFDGRQAIDTLVAIAHTERNAAHLLGRCLDAQEFFHHVTFSRRLCDSGRELYQLFPKSTAALPVGVFSILTDCYSPTCTKDNLCYSIACPRRVQQLARLAASRKSRSIEIRVNTLDDADHGTLWIHSVPEETLKIVSEGEKKRQEAINEVIYTEWNFFRDLLYLRDVWINPLRQSDVIPEERRRDFLEQVFWNLEDLIPTSAQLCDLLGDRRESSAIIEGIGDIFMNSLTSFHPFVSYSNHHIYGKHAFEQEKALNPEFRSFVEEIERQPSSRKLDLNAYLSRPATRLALYPILLENVLQLTPDENPDKQTLPRVIIRIRKLLSSVNIESQNEIQLLQLDQQLVYRPADQTDLRLAEQGRKLVSRGTLQKRGPGYAQDNVREVHVYLFDHALLMVKANEGSLKAYRRPIPLELLVVLTSKTDLPCPIPPARRSRYSLKRSMSCVHDATFDTPTKPEDKDNHAITFVHLGRRFYQVTLWASTAMALNKWVEDIGRQQALIREQNMVFETVTLLDGSFQRPSGVKCATPFHGGQRMAYGTDDGVYFSAPDALNGDPIKVLTLKDVTQIEVFDEYQLLIVFSERRVLAFPLETLDPQPPLTGVDKTNILKSGATLFKTGVCLGRAFIAVVKASPLSSTVTVIEVIDRRNLDKKARKDKCTFRLFKDFYLPAEIMSVHFLKTKICLACPSGFEIVDLETLDSQTLLDHADPSLKFALKDDVRPLVVFRIQRVFLLCYHDFAFYVERNGWRVRHEFLVYWECSPTAIALHYPYLLGFDANFVEVRHVETGRLVQIVQGSHLRCLFPGSDAPRVESATSSHEHSSVPPPPYSPDQRADRQMHLSQNQVVLSSDNRILALRMASVSNDISH